VTSCSSSNKATGCTDFKQYISCNNGIWLHECNIAIFYTVVRIKFQIEHPVQQMLKLYQALNLTRDYIVLAVFKKPELTDLWVNLLPTNQQQKVLNGNHEKTQMHKLRVGRHRLHIHNLFP
jgi:hypothetical protein